MTKYNSSYDPPAATAKVSIKKIESRERLRDIEMIIDTGSDITLLPETAIDKLGIKSFSNVKYELAGFDGSVVKSEIYHLQVIFLGKRFTGH